MEQEQLRIPNAKRGLQRTGHVDTNHAHPHAGKGALKEDVARLSGHQARVTRVRPDKSASLIGQTFA